MDQTDRSKYIRIFDLLSKPQQLHGKHLHRVLRKVNKSPGELYSKDELVEAFRILDTTSALSHISAERRQQISELIRMKPMRTHSGVAIVTVLTKPFPCPGKCIFCPNDIRMPKSYLSDEPGAQRAERNEFDPYLQVYNRLQALHNIGHPTSKVELIILGGTWSYYPEPYQIWFVKRCFDALNDFGVTDNRQQVHAENIFARADQKYNRTNDDGTAKTYNELIAEIRHAEGDLMNQGKKESATWGELAAQQRINVTAKSRCVGLVVETRPDNISPAEVRRIRRLGSTKVQLGVQTLDDLVNDKNKRGHHAIHVAKAFRLLRQAGFKIHAHLMPNLYGSTPAGDRQDIIELFTNENYKPDELKIYPTSVIKNTELYELWKQGEYQPYSTEHLIEILVDMVAAAPSYCRLTRIIRDIPSTDIEAGNKVTNLRQLVNQEIMIRGIRPREIRWREIRKQAVSAADLHLSEIWYKTTSSTEIFLSYVTLENKIAGFLRLSLPNHRQNQIFAELHECAIIREVHVYGQLVGVGEKQTGKAQHLGLGSKLIEHAKQICRSQNWENLAVISAIGTREYYRKRGFQLSEMYQVCEL